MRRRLRPHRPIVRPRPSRSIVVCLAVAMLAALSVPALMAAVPRGPGGPAWPGPAIRYFDASGWPRTVAVAVQRWNALGVGIRFVPVRRRSAAEVVITSVSAQRIARTCPDDDGAGIVPVACSTVGYAPGHRSVVVLPQPLRTDGRSPSLADLRMVEHELGHVLGDVHLRGCAVMNPDLFMTGCPWRKIVDADRFLCGPLPADVAPLLRIYHRRRPAATEDPYCSLPSAP